jgi:hypothetical protein
VSLSVDLPPGLPAVAGDRPRLQETVREILARVIGASAREAEIAIRAVHTSGRVELRVSPVQLVANDFAAERRFLEALGCSLSVESGTAVIALPPWG